MKVVEVHKSVAFFQIFVGGFGVVELKSACVREDGLWGLVAEDIRVRNVGPDHRVVAREISWF